MQIKDFGNFYNEHRMDFERLAEISCSLVEKLLCDHNVPFLQIQGRVKDKESAENKQKKKKYKNPLHEMTDLVGVRVILYLESDIEAVSRILKADLCEIPEFSVDKRFTQDIRQVGYRSLHIVCQLGDIRSSLPEYQGISDLPLEIQIRTALQHTWAEIEHKQSYKSEWALPQYLQRRLMIISGTLELVDQELSSIAELAKDYEKNIVEEGGHLNDAISVTSVAALIKRFVAEYKVEHDIVSNLAENPKVIDEILAFGCNAVEDVWRLLLNHGKTSIEIQANIGSNSTEIGLIRDLMLLENPQKYLKDAYPGDYVFDYEGVEEMSRVLDYDYFALFESFGAEVVKM